MLFYLKSHQSLDHFVRLEISKKLEWMINNINDNDLPSYTTYGHRIIIHTNSYSKSPFNKNKLIVELFIYDMRYKVLYSNHFNPYKHTFNKINDPDNIYSPTQFRAFRKTIKYKSMDLPLGKLRVKHYQEVR